MLDMNRPFPFNADMLADTDAQHVPDNGDFVVFAVRNKPGDGIAGLFVVEGQALQHAFKGLHLANGRSWRTYCCCQRTRKMRVSPETPISHASETWLPLESATQAR